MQSEEVTQKASEEVKNKVTKKNEGSKKDQHYYFLRGQQGKENDLRGQKHTSFITSRCPGDTTHAGRRGEDVPGSFHKDNKKEEEPCSRLYVKDPLEQFCAKTRTALR